MGVGWVRAWGNEAESWILGENNQVQKGVIVTSLWSPAPYLVSAIQAPSEESSPRDGGAPHQSQLLSPCLPVLLFCASYPGPCLGGGGDPLPCEPEGASAWGFPESCCLWAGSVQAPCFKGSGRELARGIPTADQELFLVFKPSRLHFTLE